MASIIGRNGLLNWGRGAKSDRKVSYERAWREQDILRQTSPGLSRPEEPGAHFGVAREGMNERHRLLVEAMTAISWILP
jgi:hypothetical protein